jgi:nucleoside-diphosphate-sugar epimerase
MTGTVLILGANGRLGRNAAAAFWNAGWSVRTHDRKTGNLMEDARGADVIMNGWHPPSYEYWPKELPKLTERVIAAAKASGATVILPGNIYVYGETAPTVLSPETPHAATNTLGKLRIELEQTYRASDVQTILVRAGDFLDTEQSGNWFDLIMAKSLPKAFTYIGDENASHAWAYLPDLAEAMVGLAGKRAELPKFTDVSFAGYTVTGRELADAVGQILGHKLRIRQFPWWSLTLAAPFWPLARWLPQVRYMWNKPHSLDGSALQTLLPDLRATPLEDALRHALPERVLRTPDAEPIAA